MSPYPPGYGYRGRRGAASRRPSTRQAKPGPRLPPPDVAAAAFSFPRLAQLSGSARPRCTEPVRMGNGMKSSTTEKGQPPSVPFNQGPFFPAPGRQVQIWVPICREMERY